MGKVSTDRLNSLKWPTTTLPYADTSDPQPPHPILKWAKTAPLHYPLTTIYTACISIIGIGIRMVFPIEEHCSNHMFLVCIVL